MVGFFKPIGAAAEEETGVEDYCRQALGAIDSGYVDTPNRLCMFNSLSTGIEGISIVMTQSVDMHSSGC